MRFRAAWIASYSISACLSASFSSRLGVTLGLLAFPSSGLRPCGALEVIGVLVRVCRLSERKLSWQVLMILRSLAVMSV